jgi:hypothetical protein
MNRYAWLMCALLLAACGPSPTDTPPPPTLPIVTPGPSPTPPPPSPTPTATPLPTTTPGSGPLRYDSDFLHQVASGAGGLYSLNALVGEAMRIEVAPDDEEVDLRLVVVAPGGRELVNMDRNGPGRPETLPEFQFPLSGAYQVRVEAVAGDGLMRGAVAFLPEAARTGGGTFQSFDDAPIDARMDSPGVFHVYTFEASAGQVVILQAVAASEDLDLYFHLFQPDGTVMGLYEDELPPNNPALLDLMLAQTGEYAALVGARAGTGDYRMSLQAGG